MAFWRIRNMDSWNPLSRLFWTKDNLIGPSLIENKRSQMRQLMDDMIPDTLKDPIMLELPNKPVFSPYGHCFNLETLAKHWEREISLGHDTTCPLTRRPLNSSLLLQGKIADQLNSILNKAMVAQAELLTMINKMAISDEEKIKKYIKGFQLQLIDISRDFESHVALIVNIDRAKERLKLDSSSSQHLQFWHQTKVSYLAKRVPSDAEPALLNILGIDKVSDKKNHDYYISRSVGAVMKTATGEYKNQEEWMHNVKRTIQLQKKSYRNIFCCCLRSKAERKLFDTTEIETVDLRMR